MDLTPIWVLFILIFLIFPMSNSEEIQVRQSLVQFMAKLSAGNAQNNRNWGWNTSSDPCTGKWVGVICEPHSQTIRKIVLEEFNFTGALDAGSICTIKSLNVLSLKRNKLGGLIPEELGNCRRLTHLYVSGNKLSGDIPGSVSRLSNLKRLDISNNYFTGELPDVARISGLLSFLAQNNRLRGPMPAFDFSNLVEFNVSNNNFSGPIPDVRGKFGADSFSGNPLLCGKPLSNNTCPPPSSVASPPKAESKNSSVDRFLIYSGYIILAIVVVILFAVKFSKKKPKKENITVVNKRTTATDHGRTKNSAAFSESKTGGNRSEYSITSVESGGAASLSPLVVLTSPVVDGLRFEDLLRAPAELLGRGKHGSLYKVVLDSSPRAILTVKRIKDWGISSEEFGRRMQRINGAKHPKVLPPMAFYCSKQEKLLVYEYQPNCSLFRLLHGSENGRVLEWGSRLNAAAIIAEALAFMHEELSEDGIGHGNLKSTNILFDKDMEPCISEYGLMVAENQEKTFLSQTNSFKLDVYGFGVILLELLTGKLVHNNGCDLASWVHSAVREEWTIEVFDRALISEGGSEERMVNLLQVALKCINPSPSDRPTMNQIAVMINKIKVEEEEEERSITLEL